MSIINNFAVKTKFAKAVSLKANVLSMLNGKMAGVVVPSEIIVAPMMILGRSVLRAS